MSLLTEAFEEVLTAAAEVKGFREMVSFRGSEIEAAFGIQTDDFRPTWGGTSDSTPITVSVRISEAGSLPIPYLEPIIVRSKSLFVLDSVPAEGRVDLICGDPTSENK